MNISAFLLILLIIIGVIWSIYTIIKDGKFIGIF